MKKLIIMVLVLRSLVFSSDIYLKDFVSIVSSSLNVTIVIDNEVDSKLSLFVSDDLDKKSYIKILGEILNSNNLVMKSFNNFYLITKKKDKELGLLTDEKTKIRSIQLYNIDYSYIKPILSVYKDLESSFVPNAKLLVVKSILSDYKALRKLINSIDYHPEQLKLKITILDTNLNKLKEYGSELTQQISMPNSNFFFNLFAYPFSVNNTIDSSQKNTLNSYIKLMNKNSITELVSSPTLTLMDDKKVSFDVVKNIPFISGTTNISDTTTQVTNSYEYKDIGLKIAITPRIYKDVVYMDLSIANESIIDDSDTPTTSKSNIVQSFRMTRNTSYILTGINQTNNYITTQKTPFLGDIPFLGWLFKTEDKNYNNSNLTIILELLDDSLNNNKNLVKNTRLSSLKVHTLEMYSDSINDWLYPTK